MLKETVGCSDLYSRCQNPEEIRSVKDMHISARIDQFSGRNKDGVDVKKCPVVKEYLESGRADAKPSEGDKCTYSQVNLHKTLQFQCLSSVFKSTDNICCTANWAKRRDFSAR